MGIQSNTEHPSDGIFRFQWAGIQADSTPDFMWQRSPFKIGDSFVVDGQKQSPGTDLSKPYWMARHYSYITNGTGQMLVWIDLVLLAASQLPPEAGQPALERHHLETDLLWLPRVRKELEGELDSSRRQKLTWWLADFWTF